MFNTSANKVVALTRRCSCLKLTIILVTLFLFVGKAESKSDIFPDLSCHKGYNATFMKDLKEKCKLRVAEALPAIICPQQCMLSHLNLYYPEPYDSSENALEDHVLLPFDTDADDKEYNGLPTMFGKKKATELTKKVTDICNALLNKIANVQRLPCNKWTIVYDCVNVALSCPF